MGALEFVSQIIRSLVWPVLIGLVIWHYRDDLRQILKRLENLEIFGTKAGFGKTIPSQEAHDIEAQTKVRKPIEYKILNTLFTKQVNKWPNYNVVWTFYIGPSSSEYTDYREAKGKLLNEGLIGETEDHMIFLTRKGFAYSKQHYAEFTPSDQWWEEEKIDPDNLNKVLSGELGPK